MIKKTDFSGRLFNTMYLPVLIIATVCMIFPVYLMFKVSVSGPAGVFTQHPSFLIKDFTFKHWMDIFQSGMLWGPLVKSLVVATTTTVIAIVIASPAAYVISRMSKEAKYFTIIALFSTRMFPEGGIAMPIAIKFIEMNLLDTNTGLILAHLIKELPYLAWILIGTFETIPRDLEKAAEIDGATKLGALWRVVFPLSIPGIAVGAMFVWLDSWNEFTYALYMTMSNNTLPLQVYYYVTRGGIFASAAYATILAIPVIIITLILQRYMQSGMMSGALK